MLQNHTSKSENFTSDTKKYGVFVNQLSVDTSTSFVEALVCIANGLNHQSRTEVEGRKVQATVIAVANHFAVFEPGHGKRSTYVTGHKNGLRRVGKKNVHIVNVWSEKFQPLWDAPY